MIPKIKYRLFFIFLLLWIISVNSAFSHEIRPAYLEIKELPGNNLEIFWKQPVSGESGIKLTPVLSSGWLADSASVYSASGTALIRKWNLRTSQSVEGQTLTIEGLENTITDVLVNIIFLDGSKVNRLIKPLEPSFEIAKNVQGPLPVNTYTMLGISHILFGADHLLFVIALVLLVKGKWQLFKTITAFTIAHSITLAAAILGWVEIPTAPVQAVITLSIIFIAVELVNLHRGKEVFVSKYPWVAAFAFGLLHGFGFAGSLAGVGLPQDNIPMALFLFNVGVEISHMIFIISILLCIYVIKKIFTNFPEWTESIIPYAIGSIAMFWFFEQMKEMLYN